ncbi:MAG: SUMF1/EgtB/PvdO family nonheme iron enzyme, partial [Chloroflexota bacterium]
RGVSAYATQSVQLPDFAAFLREQAALNDRANFDPTPPQIRQSLDPVAPTQLYTPENLPSNMVALPAFTGEMSVTITVRECGFIDIPGATYPCLEYENLHRPFSLKRPVSLSPFALDLTPVTNAQFAEFLRSTGYAPAHRENFLAHWRNGFIPAGLENHPVVYVCLEDARAYAKWVGKRLPTEEEWQFAAQGSEGRRYPWGDDWQPTFCNHVHFGGTAPVKQFPQGRTPSGIYDLCGNVWEWTESQRSDGRTRFALLKGGSFYRALGSEWYADGGAQANDFAAKFLLMYPGLDRCATIGFRCAADLAE